MNFIPKEIKDSLDNFKKSFRKLFFTTSFTSEINFSKIFENVLECDCGDECMNVCPYIPQSEIEISTAYLNQKQDFILTIKSLKLISNIQNSLYCLTMYLDNEKKNIILFKGILDNFVIEKNNYSFPLKINIPNKIIFKIILIDEKGNKLLDETNKMLRMGVVDFGLTIL